MSEASAGKVQTPRHQPDSPQRTPQVEDHAPDQAVGAAALLGTGTRLAPRGGSSGIPSGSARRSGRGLGAMQAEQVLRLQRQHGNRAVARMIEAARSPVPETGKPDEGAAEPDQAEQDTLARPVADPTASLPPLVMPAAALEHTAAAQPVANPLAQDRQARTLVGDVAVQRTVIPASAGATIETHGPVVQRGLLDRIVAGAKQLGSRAVALVEDIGEAAAEWAPRIAAFLQNPLGFLVSRAWLELPGWLKVRLMSTLLNAAETILSHLRGQLSALMGPLWPLLREFFLGFVRSMREAGDDLKVAMSDRLATLVSGTSVTFMLHFIKGLGLGLWDVVRMPYDLIVGVIDGVKFAARVAGRMGQAGLEEGIRLLAGGLPAALDGLKEMLTEPRRALTFIETIWEGMKGAMGRMGNALAVAVMGLFRLPDDRLGEEAGRLTAGVAVDAVIAYFTAGVGAVLRRAASTAAEVATWVRRAVDAASTLLLLQHLVTALIEPVAQGVTKLAEQFRGSVFGAWLVRFAAWLSQLGAAIAAALSAQSPEAGSQESGDSEEEVWEVLVESMEIELAPDVAGGVPGDLAVQRAAAGGSGAGGALPAPPKGPELEDIVKRKLLGGELEDIRLPKMDHVLPGQFRGVHGIDLFAFRHQGNRVYVYRIEVKGGSEAALKRLVTGELQTSRGWTQYAVDGLLKELENDPVRMKRFARAAGLNPDRVTAAALREKLMGGRSVIVAPMRTIIRGQKLLNRIPIRHRPPVRQLPPVGKLR